MFTTNLTFTSFLTFLAGSLLACLVLDQLYQRFSHKWTNEPPLLRYTIPFVGHALQYGADYPALFGRAQYVCIHRLSKHTSICLQESVSRWPAILTSAVRQTCLCKLIFHKRVLHPNSAQIFPHNRDVSVVFRRSKELSFLPLIEKYSGLAWGISKDGMRRLSQDGEDEESLFKNAHPFYRDALKPGPQLDAVTLKFLKFMDDALNEFDADANAGAPRSLFEWSRTILGLASTDAMMGPALLRDHVKDPHSFLTSALIVDGAFFFFVNKMPRFLGRKQYEAREEVLDALERYFSDPAAIAISAPMIKDREVQLREKGMSTRDIAAYTFSAYVVRPLFFSVPDRLLTLHRRMS